MNDPRNYTAFISYRHTEPDQRISRMVHHALEAYRIPRALRKDREGSRLGDIFRDDEELSASPSLPASIEQALANSQWLIVICTPAAAKSLWVEREIRTFVAMHGRGRVLAVLAAGDQNTSFPPAIRSSDTAHSEPLACDLREVKSPFSRRRELLRLVAPIIGCAYDELIQRRRQRGARIAIATACAIIATLGILLTTAWMETQRLRIAESIALSEQSRDLLAEGDRIGAIQTALDALPDSNSNPLARPFVDEAQSALADALGVYPSADAHPYQFRARYEHRMQGRIEAIAISPDATLIACRDATSTIDILDADSGALVHSFSSDPNHIMARPELLIPHAQLVPSFTGDLVLSDSYLLVSYSYFHTICFDIETGDIIWSKAYSNASGHAISHDGKLASIASRNGDAKEGTPDTLLLLSMENGEQVAEIPLPMRLNDGETPWFNADDSLILIPGTDTLTIVDVKEMTAHMMPWNLGSDTSLMEIESGVIAAHVDQGPSSSCTVAALNLEDGSLLWSISIPSSEQSDEAQEGTQPFVLPAYDGVCFLVTGAMATVIDTGSGEALETIRLPGNTIDAVAPNLTFPEGSAAAYITLQDGSRLCLTYAEGQLGYAELEDLSGPRLSASQKTETGGLPAYIQASAPKTDGSALEVHKQVAFSAVDGFEPLATGLSPSFPNVDASRLLFIAANPAQGRNQNIVFDTQNLENLGAIDLAALGITESVGVCASQNPDVIVFRQQDDSGAFTLSTVDIEQGDLIAQRTWPAEELAFCSTDPACGLLCVTYGDTIEVLDEETLETVADYRNLPVTSPRIMGAIASDSTIAVLLGQYADGEHNLALLNRATGEFVDDTELGLYSVATMSGASAYLHLDEAHNNLLVSCQDGMVRSFDMGTGDLLWEYPSDVSAGGYMAMSPDDESVLLQESSGRFVALDANTGEELGVSEDIPGSLQFTAPTAESDVIQGFYANIHDDGTYGLGLVTFHLAEDGLHIRDNIPYGVFLTEENDRVAIWHSGFLGSVPYYDYRDLRVLAEETIDAYQAGDQ